MPPQRGERVIYHHLLYLVDAGLILLPKPRDNGQIFGGDEGSNCPEKTTIWLQVQVHFCLWTFVPEQNGLNKEVSVSNCGTSSKGIFSPFLTRAANLSLLPWESGNK